mmetsp:Transcript_32888/g.29772  ORF Transcript_32888/g.29772 Transcript_32888/m.29772 type:complete len:128 (-) Transcript_32888:962-1345(-)
MGSSAYLIFDNNIKNYSPNAYKEMINVELHGNESHDDFKANFVDKLPTLDKTKTLRVDCGETFFEDYLIAIDVVKKAFEMKSLEEFCLIANAYDFIEEEMALGLFKLLPRLKYLSLYACDQLEGPTF